MNTTPPGVPDRRSTPLAHERDGGFTLIEILIAIVLVGVLSAVAVVGIARLTDRASAASCAATADASRVATTSYYASRLSYPASFTDLVSSTSGSGGGALVVPNGVAVSGSTMSGKGWSLTMVPGTPPTFNCAAAATTGPDNGVAVESAVVDGQIVLTLTSSSTITALTGTFSTRQTTGATFNDVPSNLWGGTVSISSSSASGFLVYTFRLLPGQTIVAGTWKLDGQWTGPGALNLSRGDTWSITTTADGRANTVTGTF